MLPDFSTRVAGIPCICRVTTRYTEAIPDKETGLPDHDTFDFEILDTRGRKAPWLSKKLSEKDSDRLREEFLDLRLEEYWFPY